jgi:hypothetical protein
MHFLAAGRGNAPAVIIIIPQTGGARVLGARRLAAHPGLVRGLDAASLARETAPEYADAAKALSLSTPCSAAPS